MKNRYFLPAVIFVAGIASGAFIFVLVADTIFSRGKPSSSTSEATPLASNPRSEQLIEQLADRDERKRQDAENQLLAMGIAALQALQNASQDHNDADVKGRCQKIFNKILNDRIEALAEGDVLKRTQAEQELVQAGQLAVRPLELAAQNHSSHEVRAKAQKLLGQLNAGGLAGNEPQHPAAPRLAEGPTDKQLERLRKSLAGQMLLDQTTGKMLTANQLTREQLVMLWEQMNPKKAVVQNMPEMPKPDETARALMSALGAGLGEGHDGVRITSVKQGSPAAAAGMRSGDVLTKVNNRQINTLDDLKDALERTEAGKPVRIEVSRRGEFLTLNLPR